jgi:hypothetical protein
MAGSRDMFVRTPFVHLDTSDILQQPVTVLLGVSEAARDALHKLGIETVFDLGASSVFSTARAVTSAAAVGSASARLGVVPSDWLQPDATFDSLEDIGQSGIEQLRGIAPADAAELKAALDVESIQELASWPPHATARALLRETVGGTSDPEESQAEELRPRMGEYPTERVYYSTLVMLQMQPDDEELDALDSPVSLLPAVERKSGFNKPAVGALLTYSQSWYSQGITLGQLLHCLALAPGEATRIALVDWTRKQAAMTEEASPRPSGWTTRPHTVVP